MKKPDQAFWLTVIPAVILWNGVRPAVVGTWLEGVDVLGHTSPSTALMGANLLISCILALAAGLAAALHASPQHLKAAGNVAVGVVLAFGLQNLIEYREAGLPPVYFVVLPVVSAIAAILGGGLGKSVRRAISR